MKRWLPPVALCVACQLAVTGSAAAEGAAEALLTHLLGPTPIVSDLEHLADSIGGRPTGSPALDAAIDWSIARLRGAGLENVRAETYTAPRLWGAESESGEVVAPPRAPWQTAWSSALRVAGMPFSSATSAAGLEAEVVDGGDGSEAAFAPIAGRAAGRWVLVHTEPMASIEDLFKEYMVTPGIASRVRQAGAAGLLWMSNRQGRLLYRHNITLDGSLFPLPAAVVEREGALRIARLLRTGQTVRLRLTLRSDSPVAATARNVVAEIRGREKPEEVIVLGAHLDSWDLGRGALDNGCNVALVLDVARQAMALARTGVRPRRTLRFVLYSGEEAGIFGSFGDVRSHRRELGDLKAVVIFDEGTGRTSGFSLGGRTDLQPAVESALAPVAALGPFSHTADAFVGTDNYDYLVEGVPNLVANQAGAPYLPDYHAESDTFDKADLRELKANAAIAGVLCWGLADGERPPARRQSRAEVEALLKATALDSQMKTFGLWQDFVSGARGRAPEP